MNPQATFDMYASNLAELNGAMLAAGGIGIFASHLKLTTQEFLILLARNNISIDAEYRGKD